MGVNAQVIRLLEQAIGLLRSTEQVEELREETTVSAAQRRPIAWGAKVSPTFKERVWWIAETLETNPDWLMSAMAFETGRTFSASVKNAAGSGATGLIQFMRPTAIGLGTTTTKLAQMTAEDQLNYVYKYLKAYAGMLNSLEDVYMAILYPKAVGKSLDYVLFSSGLAYSQNKGLDTDKNGNVTKREASVKLNAILKEGLLSKNIG